MLLYLSTDSFAALFCGTGMLSGMFAAKSGAAETPEESERLMQTGKRKIFPGEEGERFLCDAVPAGGSGRADRSMTDLFYNN